MQAAYSPVEQGYIKPDGPAQLKFKGHAVYQSVPTTLQQRVQ